MLLVMRYKELIQSKMIDDDPKQRAILGAMQEILDGLSQTQKSWWPFSKKKAVQGLYLYGDVGVGKTFLVDLFYDTVPVKKKARFHFHHFMQQIDIQLRRLQGHKDPLRVIAKQVAQTTQLLCFDEFLVNDVAYAMILAELLQALVREGVVLVISSNTKPEDLYKNGVHRSRFLPAIALINQECAVLNLTMERDYRLGRIPLLEAYLTPLNDDNKALMEKQFCELSDAITVSQTITLQNRELPFLKCSKQSIWFSFDVLCNFPRSQLDYLEIADRFDNLFLSNVPRLTEKHIAETILFIYLIDVMYDRGVNVVINAEVALSLLYLEGEMIEPFKRTLSRLNEMQSKDYLARHPKRVVHDIIE